MTAHDEIPSLKITVGDEPIPGEVIGAHLAALVDGPPGKKSGFAAVMAAADKACAYRNAINEIRELATRTRDSGEAVYLLRAADIRDILFRHNLHNPD